MAWDMKCIGRKRERGYDAKTAVKYEIYFQKIYLKLSVNIYFTYSKFYQKNTKIYAHIL